MQFSWSIPEAEEITLTNWDARLKGTEESLNSALTIVGFSSIFFKRFKGFRLKSTQSKLLSRAWPRTAKELLAKLSLQNGRLKESLLLKNEIRNENRHSCNTQSVTSK